MCATRSSSGSALSAHSGVSPHSGLWRGDPCCSPPVTRNSRGQTVECSEWSGNGNAVAASPLPEIILISCRNCSGNFHIQEGLFQQKGWRGEVGGLWDLLKLTGLMFLTGEKKKKRVDIELQRCKEGVREGMLGKCVMRLWTPISV